jgi:hypothetical protein
MWSALEPLEGTHPTGRFGWSLDLRGSWAGEPMLLAVGAYATRTNDGQVHVFHRMSDSWVPLASQPTPAGAAGSVLGWSIAVSGDVVAAAAPGHTSSAGAVFLFVLDEGGGWTNGPVVVAPDGESGDKFGGGWSNGIVISGDLLIVGAPGAGPRLTETFPVALEALGAGRVYVFQ